MIIKNVSDKTITFVNFTMKPNETKHINEKFVKLAKETEGLELQGIKVKNKPKEIKIKEDKTKIRRE